MRKTYRYKNLSFPAGDDEEVRFTVEFVSDGNMGHTVVDVPTGRDPEIEDEGTESLGKGKNLRNSPTVSFSDISNAVPEEDFIRINYKINDRILVRHENEKAEEDRPYIVLTIDFPKK
ncbi:MAG: hypothetical protein R3220_03640 [Balneolaceae bacterium]|nr:hypothetical protein [Balneolaceae bacterium]